MRDHAVSLAKLARGGDGEFEMSRVKAPVKSVEGSGKGHFLQPKWGDGPWGEGSLRDRFEVVRPLIRGGSLLDIGCASRYGRPDWLHGLLANEVSDVVGIDINDTTIETLKSEGYNARLGDARDFDLHRKFDVVFAGELIEHLDDVRGFLGQRPSPFEPWWSVGADHTERLLRRQLCLPLRRSRKRAPRAHLLVLRGHPATGLGGQRVREYGHHVYRSYEPHNGTQDRNVHGATYAPASAGV